jgi:hypothetical protein
MNQIRRRSRFSPDRYKACPRPSSARKRSQSSSSQDRCRLYASLTNPLTLFISTCWCILWYDTSIIVGKPQQSRCTVLWSIVVAGVLFLPLWLLSVDVGYKGHQMWIMHVIHKIDPANMWCYSSIILQATIKAPAGQKFDTRSRSLIVGGSSP